MPTRSETPIYQQYLRLKNENPDAILLVRLGDFYEAFGDDAETWAQECNLVLTKRYVGGPEKYARMAGVPYHASEAYIEKLRQAGYNVAIAEPIGEAICGLVPRAVTRLYRRGGVGAEHLDP